MAAFLIFITLLLFLATIVFKMKLLKIAH